MTQTSAKNTRTRGPVHPADRDTSKDERLYRRRLLLLVLCALVLVAAVVLLLTGAAEGVLVTEALTTFATEHRGATFVGILPLALSPIFILISAVLRVWGDRFAPVEAVAICAMVVVGAVSVSNLWASNDAIVERIEAKYDVEVGGAYSLNDPDAQWSINYRDRRCDSSDVLTDPYDPVLRCAPPDPQDVKTELDAG